MFDITALAAEFPHDVISWRAQSVTKDGTKAMALAYIDARDVMRRLDDVCGPAGWQCRYPHAGAKTICEVGIKIGDEWVWKANGAGDTDIEAEKGAISDAFKRAAVLWGIGRYLYDMPAPWVPCECNEYNGKHQWKRWTADPWTFVKGQPVKPSASASKAPSRDGYTRLEQSMRANRTADDLIRWWNDPECIAERDKLPPDWKVNLQTDYRTLGTQLRAKETKADNSAVQNMMAGE